MPEITSVIFFVLRKRGFCYYIAMDQQREKWLAAVSGGPDSMAMLAMALERGIDVAVAHVNYHQRPQAEEEEAYVRSFAAEHGLQAYVRIEPFVYEGNFEAAAREWRYDFFVSLVREYGFAGVLIAHQEDDLIETFLMQEEKGLIPAYYGLQEEMMYHGVRIRRPLLDHTAQDLLAYCQDRGIRYYIDDSNENGPYTRSRIRRIVAPMTRTERDMILREIRMKNAVMQERRCRIRTLIRSERIRLEEYRRQTQEERDALLRIFLDENGSRHLSLAWLRQIDHILMSRNDFMIPFGEQYIVQKEGSFFLYAEKEEYCDVFMNMAEVLAGGGAYYRIAPGEAGVNAVTVREDDFPLTIRSFCEGDAIVMRYGTKAVHRFFIDRHVPLYERRRWPIVVNASGRVILVPGLGCDRSHYSIKPDFNVLQYTS